MADADPEQSCASNDTKLSDTFQYLSANMDALADSKRSAGKKPPKDMRRLKHNAWYTIISVARWGDSPALLLAKVEKNSPAKDGAEAVEEVVPESGFYKPPIGYLGYPFEEGDRIKVLEVGYSKSRNQVAKKIEIRPMRKDKKNVVAPLIMEENVPLKKKMRRASDTPLLTSSRSPPTLSMGPMIDLPNLQLQQPFSHFGKAELAPITQMNLLSTTLSTEFSLPSYPSSILPANANDLLRLNLLLNNQKNSLFFPQIPSLDFGGDQAQNILLLNMMNTLLNRN